MIAHQARLRRCATTATLALLLPFIAGAATRDGKGSSPPSVGSKHAPPDPSDTAPKEITAKPVLPTLADLKPRDYPGIHNAVAYHQNFISGSVPEGDAAFDALQAMGVKTIISVDGAIPEVDEAKARGMRYIHLPIGYSGFDEARKLELSRAVRDAIADGPVYLHCHHGKHRSAGAAGTVAVSLGWATPDAMVERMKVSGTAPGYKGLYACTRDARPLPPSVIDAVSPDFPSISRPSSFVQGMVDMDFAFDHLKLIEKAGWKTPKDHPDLVPAAEAGRLAELFRHLKDGSYSRRKPEDFRAWMQSSHEQAQLIEDQLASATPDLEKIAAAFKALGASCKECHVAYRD